MKASIYITFLVFTLASCGGSDGDGGDTTSIGSAATSLANNDNDNQSLPSNDQARTSNNFSNFDNYNVEISMDDFAMSGAMRFIKVMDVDRNVLYLGKAPNTGVIQLPIHIGVAKHPITVEVFSESAQDATISQEIAL